MQFSDPRPNFPNFVEGFSYIERCSVVWNGDDRDGSWTPRFGGASRRLLASVVHKR